MTTATTSRAMNLEKRTALLTFVRDPSAPPDGEYVLRGGICWPVIVDRETGRMEGFALTAGRHVKSGQSYVLAQAPFVCVDHILEDGRIKFAGLCTWFVDCWARWFADTYAWKQPWETNRRYLRQVLESAMIHPKPHLVELDWADDDDARAIVYEVEAAGRLAYEAGSPLHQSLLSYAVAEPADRDRFPAVHALTCALFALESASPHLHQRTR